MPLHGTRCCSPRQRITAIGAGFDHTPRDLHAWWYLDALSEDHQHGLTIIVFFGSVFSPYYAIARRQGRRTR